MKQAAAFFTPQFIYAEAPTWANETLKLENTSPLEGWMLRKICANSAYKASGSDSDFPENVLGAEALVTGYQAVMEPSTTQWN